MYLIVFYSACSIFYRGNLYFIKQVHWLKHSKFNVARPFPLFGVACFLSLLNSVVVLTFHCIIQAHFPANNTLYVFKSLWKGRDIMFAYDYYDTMKCTWMEWVWEKLRFALPIEPNLYSQHVYRQFCTEP